MIDPIRQGAGQALSVGNAPSVANAPKEGTLQAMQEEVKEIQESKNVEDLKKDLMQLTEQLNKEFNPLNMNVKFGFSDDIESLYVTVSERDTNKLIRKIPSDEAMELMAKMREIVGMIFDKKG